MNTIKTVCEFGKTYFIAEYLGFWVIPKEAITTNSNGQMILNRPINGASHFDTLEQASDFARLQAFIDNETCKGASLDEALLKAVERFAK